MHVVIRLQKTGKSANKHYNFRVVAMPKKASRQADHLEVMGYYDPGKKPAALKLDREKIERWVKQGAQLSETVKSLLKQQK